MNIVKKLTANKRTFFAFPYLAISIIFVVVPLVFIFAYAFKDPSGGFSLSNFTKFFTMTKIWTTIGNSFLMAFLTTLICFLLCYPLALALMKVKTGRTAMLVMMFILPMWINSLLRIYAVQLLLESKLPPGFMLVLVGMVYDFLPFMLLPIYTILVNTDQSVINAAYDLGSSPMRTLLRVRLPLSVPGIVSGALMVFMPTMSTFAISQILSGGTLTLFGNLIDGWFERPDGQGRGSAYSIVLMLLILVSMLVANKISKGKALDAMGGAI